MSFISPVGKEKEQILGEPTSSRLFLCPRKTKARLMPHQLWSALPQRLQEPPSPTLGVTVFLPLLLLGWPMEHTVFLANISRQQSQCVKISEEKGLSISFLYESKENHLKITDLERASKREWTDGLTPEFISLGLHPTLRQPKIQRRVEVFPEGRAKSFPEERVKLAVFTTV